MRRWYFWPLLFIFLSIPLFVLSQGQQPQLPSLVAGPGITIAGIWPNQIISAIPNGGGGIPGNTLAAHNFANSINSIGTLSGLQPSCADLSNAGTGCSGNFASPPAIGNTTPAAGTFSALTDTVMTGGPFCVHETNGVMTASSLDCGAGSGQIYQYTLTEIAGAATMVSTSSAFATSDVNTIALIANATITTPASSTMALGEENTLHATTSGTAWTVTFAPGTGTILRDAVLGSANTANTNIGQTCVVPATGSIYYHFRWNGTNYDLLYCGPYPAPTFVGQSIGGTGATSLSGWPIICPHTQTVSGAVTEALQNCVVTSEVFTFSATATVTIPQASFASASGAQSLQARVCQNGTGGFTPSFTPIAGLTIVGTFPVFTTTASKCGNFVIDYITPTSAYLDSSNPGPL